MEQFKTTEKRETFKVLAALFVRCLFVLHSILAVWRVVIAQDDVWMWCLVVANIPLLLETFMVVKFNGGNEWKWWCPCFLLYLLSTLPSIWFLQLSQNDKLRATTFENTDNFQPTPQVVFGGSTPDNENGNNMGNVTDSVNITDNNTESTTLSMLSSTIPTTTDSGILVSIEALLGFEDTTWIVVMQELLMYLIVFGRWILPRAGVSRVALSDLLLVYLAMASDIMELYAVFDEQVVQEDRDVTYAILTIWSLSFLQFIPVLAQKNKTRQLQSPRLKRITRACGEHFSEVFMTVSSIVLQDGPFFCLRLYIMIKFQLVTYSLVFFVLKNFVSVLLLIYRLVILCFRLPCCNKGNKIDEEQHIHAGETSSTGFSRHIFARHSDSFLATNGQFFYAPKGMGPQTLPSPSSSQLFVVTHGKHKYLATPGIVNRHNINTGPSGSRLGTL